MTPQIFNKLWFMDLARTDLVLVENGSLTAAVKLPWYKSLLFGTPCDAICPIHRE